MGRDPRRDGNFIRAMEEAREQLGTLPEVTSVGMGRKLVGGRDTGQLCIQFGVEEKLPFEGIPPARRLPSRLGAGRGEVPTDVVPTSRFSCHTSGHPFPCEVPERRRRARPAMGGYSVGHHRSTAGTLGAALIAPNHARFVLSNNHVLALCNRARPGDPILQPGPVDGGNENDDVLATLDRFVPLDPSGPNQTDAALARVGESAGVLTGVHLFGTVLGPGPTRLGCKVRKCGRTTGATSGIVTRVAVTARVHYDTDILLFTDVFETTPMSHPGDSGSAVLDGGNRILGLLFAGSPLSTLVCPIGPIVDAFELHEWSWY